MKFLKDIGNIVLRYVKDTARLKSLSLEDLTEIIELNVEAHNNLALAFKDLTPTNRLDILTKYKQVQINKSKLPSVEVPDLIKRKLVGNAVKLERDKPFEALVYTNKMLLKVQQDILKKVDQIVADKEISLLSVRVSGTALLGLIRQSQMYSTYMGHLMDQVFTCIHSPGKQLPKYRAMYLLDNLDEFVTITNQVCDRNSKYTFLTEIDNIKKKNANALLYANGNTIDNFIGTGKLTASVQSYMTSAISILNIFLWGGEMVDDFKHQRHLRNKNMKSWLESHVAHLKMDLANEDPNSPKAVRLQKIIDSYDAEIAMRDQKINAYLDKE